MSAESNQARPNRLLVADGHPLSARQLATLLRELGHDVNTAPDAASTLKAVLAANDEERPFDVALVDLSLPGDGFGLLRELGKGEHATATIAIADQPHVGGAIEALRLGVSDYLVRPLVEEEVRQALARALRQAALLGENLALRRRLHARGSLDSILGSDPRMLAVFDLVRAVAPGRTTVLMTGESGTGKSLVAHAIHRLGPRHDKPFVELSCGSIPETLLESELFGHVKGAFTGAHSDKAGRFAAADGGTIFLDEINSASPGMQLKLLRVLQERRFEPVGSTKTVEVDARVILASNQPLEQLVAAGAFRQDLYYRINVVRIELPPLRDRRADIPLLAARFLEEHARQLGRQLVGFSDEALAMLTRYSFPGNVRELQNIIERATVLARGQRIEVDDLPPQVRSHEPTPQQTPGLAAGTWVPMTLEEALREPERQIIRRALEANGWNRGKTADQLGINRTTLYKKMRQLGMQDVDRLAG